MKNKNNGGYSVIIILLIIGLLLFLGIGIFGLILNDMKDNKAMGDYIRAYAGAESASELALLQVKKHGYGYDDIIAHDINNRSVMLASNPLDVGNFKKSTDVFLSYDIGSKVQEYNGEVEPLGYDIIPLFYINDSDVVQKITNLAFSIEDGVQTNLAWNIIGNNSGLSGIGNISSGTKRSLDTNNNFVYSSSENINDFLQDASNTTNYLVLLNTGNSGNIKYKIESTDSSQYFSKPRTEIITSAQVGNYKQNLSVNLDNTEFLNILKYSIYSN